MNQNTPVHFSFHHPRTLSQSCETAASTKASGQCNVVTGGRWGGDSAELVQDGARGAVPGGVLMLPGQQVELAAAAASALDGTDVAVADVECSFVVVAVGSAGLGSPLGDPHTMAVALTSLPHVPSSPQYQTSQYVVCASVLFYNAVPFSPLSALHKIYSALTLF